MSDKVYCYWCFKRLRLSERIECKCENVYCLQHRYADEHACDYDYQTTHQMKIALENPLVVPTKVDKI